MSGRRMHPVGDDVPPQRAALAQELRILRARAGMDMRGIAEQCGVSTSTVSRIFAGQVMPEHDLAEKIVTACGGDWRSVETFWRVALLEQESEKRKTDRLHERLVFIEERLSRIEQLLEALAGGDVHVKHPTREALAP